MDEDDLRVLLDPNFKHFNDINYTNGSKIRYMEDFKILDFPEKDLDKLFYFFFDHSNSVVSILQDFFKKNIYKNLDFKSASKDYQGMPKKSEIRNHGFMDRCLWSLKKIIRGLFFTGNGYLALSIFNYLADLFKESITSEERSNSSYFSYSPKISMKLNEEIKSAVESKKLKDNKLGKCKGAGENGERRVIGNYKFSKWAYKDAVSKEFKTMNFLEALIFSMRSNLFLLDYNYHCNKFFLDQLGDKKYR